MAFRTLSDLPAPERSRLIYVAVGFMCVATAALIARSAGDALFLSYYSTSLLSYMYLGTAFVLIVASLAFGAGPSVIMPAPARSVRGSGQQPGRLPIWSSWLSLRPSSPSSGWLRSTLEASAACRFSRPGLLGPS